MLFMQSFWIHPTITFPEKKAIEMFKTKRYAGKTFGRGREGEIKLAGFTSPFCRM